MNADDEHNEAVGSDQTFAVPTPKEGEFTDEPSTRDLRFGTDSQSKDTVEARIDTPAHFKSLFDSANVFPPGSKLGNFRILQHIASGGMGQVYRACDERLDRDVAIKILPRAFARDPVLRSRFQAEARAASALNHPNIVAIHDIGSEGDLCWIVSELVDGHSLRWLLDIGPLTPRRIIEIGAQIAEGLAAAHAAGFIHRDLKPENIMLTRENRVKILDFGLVKSAVRPTTDAADANITQANVVIGTPGYMSPEHIVGGPIDQRSDIFSLGVLLYEMLAQKRPFTGDNRTAIMKATLMEEVPPLPSRVPVELARITERCLEKEPYRRMQAASDVAFALQMSVTSKSQGFLRSMRWRRRRVPWAWLAAAASLALATSLAAAAVVFWVVQAKPPAESPQHGTLHRLTWDRAMISNSAISRDGKFVAYASDQPNGRDLNIFVQLMDGGGLVQLTNDSQSNDDPTFTPDSTRIAFVVRRGLGGIYEMPVLGGNARLHVPGGRHPRFSPDGRYLLYAIVGSESSGYGGSGTQLWVQPTSGGSPTYISRGCTSVVPQAVWSPDSERILTSAICDGKLGLWLLSPDGSTRLATDGDQLWKKRGLNPPVGLKFQRLDQWLSNPSAILLPLEEGDIRYEVKVPISGQGTHFLEPVQPINFGPSTINHASASDSGRTALTVYDRSVNVWEIPIDMNGHRTGNPTQLTNSRGMLIHPALSPDGQNVAFVLAHEGRDELQVLNLKSQALTTLNAQMGYIRHPVFSLDGSSIDYQTRAGAFEISIHGGAAAQILPINGYVSDWSSDGRQFLWVDGTSISLVDRKTLQMIPILTLPGGSVYQAHFSPDGKYVTFNAQKQHSQIYAAPLRSGAVPVSDWIPLTDGTTWDDKPRLSADGKMLFFVSELDGYPCIWLQRIDADMHRVGKAEEVYPSHLWRRSMSGAGLGDVELNVWRDKLIFTQAETFGSVWVLDPPTPAKQ